MFLTATRTKKCIIKQLIIMLMHLIYDYAHAHDFVPDCSKTQDCVIKLSILILLQYNLFLNTIILMKSVIKLLILVLYLTLFLIDLSLKKCLTEFFSEDHFMLQYCPDRHKAQKMCCKAVDSCLSTLKFVPDWFVTDKMIKKLYETLFANIILLWRFW